MSSVELYRFVQGATITTLTSGDTDVTYAAEVYTKTAIGRTNIEVRNELAKSNIDVSIGINHASAQLWMNGLNESSVSVTIYSQDGVTTEVIWKGRISGVKPGESDVKFTCESVFTSMRRTGLRARFQRTCRHALYKGKCGLSMGAFAQAKTATAASSDGLVITVTGVSAEPGEYFTGMLQAADGTLRFIVLQSGNDVTLSRPIPSLTTALGGGPVTVTLYPGCDRSRARCKDKFNNLNRNGSFPFIPIRNPFNGSSIA